MKFLKLRSKRPPHKCCRAPLGVAAVEFAIVAPVLLLILFLMVESSRYLTAVHATTGAAREAVRLSAITGADDATALARAKEFMTNSGFKSNSVKLDITSDATAAPGLTAFTATVTIPFSDVSVVGDPFNLNVTEVRGDSAMAVAE